MEIVKHGNRPRYFATCPNCGCCVEFGEAEATTAFDHGEFRYVICPECLTPIHDVHFKELEK